MKIAFVAPFGLGKKTTVWARTLPLARQLVAHGHPTAILIPPWDTPADAGKRWHDGGVELVNTHIGGGAPLTLLRLLRASNQFSPDLIHIVKPRAHAGLFQWSIWRMRQLRLAAPTLLLDMDDWEQAWAPINRYPKLVAMFLAWQEEWGIRHADGITTASQWLHRRAQEYAPTTPALYLPNGIDDALLSGSSPLPRRKEANSPKNILFFTRYVEVTPVWLADFAAHLLGPDDRVRLVIAGAPLQPNAVQMFQSEFATRKFHNARQIEWLGAVPTAGLPALLAGSTCAIFPAQPTVLQLAKCSVRLATTLLHGVPVVASAVGEQSQYGAEGAGRLVSADATPAQFAQAVLDLLADEDAQNRMIAAARHRLAENYSWRRLGAQLAAFYEHVMGARAG